MKSGNDVNPLQNRTFCYARRWQFARYLTGIAGLAFMYFVVAVNGGRPFSNFVFPLILFVALLDVVGGAVLRAKSPRAFHLHGDKLTIEWSNEVLTIDVDNLKIRRDLSWLLSSGWFLKAGGRTFAVFNDLEDAKDLIAVCSQNHSKNRDNL